MPNLVCGFTLIELLVVVAIIGILTSVALASLSSARTKAADASVKAHLSQLRAQIEMDLDSDPYYGAYGYDGVLTIARCTVAAAPTTKSILFNDTAVVKIMKSIATASGASLSGSNNNSIVGSSCATSADSYGVYLKLKSGKYVCVDSSGGFKDTYTGTYTFTGTSGFVCP